MTRVFTKNLISFYFLSAVLLPACNCGDSDLGELSSEFSVTPEILQIPSKPAGVSSTAKLTLVNSGETVLTIVDTTVTSTVFKLNFDTPQTLAPAESIIITVIANAEQIGIHQASAVFRTSDNGPRASVSLFYESVQKPPCDDGNICTQDLFDITTETCSHRYLNGIPCTSADRCIIEATCNQGVCRGETKVCDDESPCTRDFCRQIDGECIFIENDEACDDDNPCTNDVCSSNGCRNPPIENGAPCDDEDTCTNLDACFNGACIGRGTNDNGICDDLDSCTENDRCIDGKCVGTSRINGKQEGEIVFDYRLNPWPSAFVHRREVSLSDDQIAYLLDHHPLEPPQGMAHVISTMKQCGTPDYEFSYQPPDGLVYVRYVRREMQLQLDNTLRICVGVRQLPENGYAAQTTTYLLDRNGQSIASQVRTKGGETGRSLLPDGSHVYGIVWPLTEGAPTEAEPALQNLLIVREARTGQILWQHERASLDWAEFLGVAGPRVLFWSNFRFGALDLNTGAAVWTQPTNFIAKEMALSTQLNLGVARVGMEYQNSQILGVELLNGREVFVFPETEDLTYLPRTDPVITPDGRIVVLMQRSRITPFIPLGLEWVELEPDGRVRSTTPLPYSFPAGWEATRVEDDPYIAIAEDGVGYVGYGDQFWAVNPGGAVRWTVTSTLANGFTGTAPLIRDDNTLLVTDGNRRILGIKTNGAKLAQDGWPTFRHDNRRTNFTP
ncbi:MAG: hypothetical protein VYC39_05900 [Myxococcota bacterium]|nr:hypothetical protein [Myxococcota bacterium]